MNEINETIRLGDCFKLLAACFYEPEKSLFIEEAVGDKLGLLLDNQSPAGATAARDMQSAIQKLDQEKLSIDHAALFVGPFELIAAPYGSVYIEKKRLVMGKSTLNAAHYYQEAGLSVDIQEPPDHIVIELEFMYYLCSKEAGAVSAGLVDEVNRFKNIQARFFHEVMHPWVPEFCQAITAGTDNLFYIHLSECLGYFMVMCEKVYKDKVFA